MIRVASLFAQVLSLISRRDFRKAVRQRDAEKAAQGFSCWDPFVAMLFCQLGGAHSLREICGGLATALGKLRHLGLAWKWLDAPYGYPAAEPAEYALPLFANILDSKTRGT